MLSQYLTPDGRMDQNGTMRDTVRAQSVYPWAFRNGSNPLGYLQPFRQSTTLTAAYLDRAGIVERKAHLAWDQF